MRFSALFSAGLLASAAAAKVDTSSNVTDPEVAALLATALETETKSESARESELKYYAAGAACYGWLTMDYLFTNCTASTKKKSGKCKTAAFAKSATYCVSHLMNQTSAEDQKKYTDTNFEYLRQSINSTKITLDVIRAYPKTFESLSRDEPTNTKNVTTAFAPSASGIEAAYSTYWNQTVIQMVSYNYARALLGFWLGVCVIKALLYWMGLVAPSAYRKLDIKPVRKFRQYVTLPAMFRYRHSTQPRFLGMYLNLPTRFISLITFVGVSLGVILIFANLQTQHVHNYMQQSWTFQLNRSLSLRSAYVMMYLMPLLILFGGRNNFLIWLTGWPMDTFNVFHKWIGRILFFQMICHAGSKTYIRVSASRYKEMWSTPYWNWGMAAIFIAAAIMVQANLSIRRLSYETFLIVHIILAILFVVTTYYHLYMIGDESLGYHYAIFAIWGFDRLARLVRIVLSNPLAKATIVSHHNSTIEITVNYSRLWKVFPGSYVFVHILQPSMFWESHPFSMMDCVAEHEHGQIKMYARVKDGMTKRIQALCEKNGGQLETRVWLDGPYGTWMNLHGFQEVLLVAGGIGITAPFSHIQSLITRGHTAITLNWGILDERPLEWFAKEIEFMKQHGVKINIFMGLDSPAIDAEKTIENAASASSNSNSNNQDDKQQLTDSVHSVPSVHSASSLNIRQHMMDVYGEVSDAIVRSQGSLAILCCGPGGVNDSSRKAVSENLCATKNYVEYFEESFSW